MPPHASNSALHSLCSISCVHCEQASEIPWPLHDARQGPAHFDDAQTQLLNAWMTGSPPFQKFVQRLPTHAQHAPSPGQHPDDVAGGQQPGGLGMNVHDCPPAPAAPPMGFAPLEPAEPPLALVPALPCEPASAPPEPPSKVVEPPQARSEKPRAESPRAREGRNIGSFSWGRRQNQ